MIPVAIFWSALNERSRRCSDGISTSYQSLKAKCLMLYSWVDLSPIDHHGTFLIPTGVGKFFFGTLLL